MRVKTAGFLIVVLVIMASVTGCSSSAVSSQTETAPAVTGKGTTAPSTSASTIVSSASTSGPTAIITSAADTASTAEAPLTILIGLDGGFNPLTMTIAHGVTLYLENDDCCNAHTVNSNYPFTKNIVRALRSTLRSIRLGNIQSG